MRRKDGQVRVTDGPYSESKEVLGRLLHDRGRQLRQGHRSRTRLSAPRLRRHDRGPAGRYDVIHVLAPAGRPSVSHPRGAAGRLARADLRSGAPGAGGGSRPGRAAQGAAAVALHRRAAEPRWVALPRGAKRGARRAPAHCRIRGPRPRDCSRTRANVGPRRRPDAIEATIEGDELRMVFMCCHPSLAPSSR